MDDPLTNESNPCRRTTREAEQDYANMTEFTSANTSRASSVSQRGVSETSDTSSVQYMELDVNSQQQQQQRPVPPPRPNVFSVA